MLLAMDTATSTASLALYNLETDLLLAEWTWQARRRHTQELLVAAQTLLDQSRVTTADLSALAVTTGPGSFTGVRIAVSIVKGMVLGLSQPPRVIGVPTLTVTASPWLDVAGFCSASVCAVIQAGRGRYNWVYFAADERLSRPGTDRHMVGDAAALAEDLAAQTSTVLLAGETTDELRQAVAALKSVVVVDTVSALRRAGALAGLAAQFLRADIEDDPVGLQPLYLRAP